MALGDFTFPETEKTMMQEVMDAWPLWVSKPWLRHRNAARAVLIADHDWLDSTNEQRILLLDWSAWKSATWN